MNYTIKLDKLDAKNLSPTYPSMPLLALPFSIQRNPALQSTPPLSVFTIQSKIHSETSPNCIIIFINFQSPRSKHSAARSERASKLMAETLQGGKRSFSSASVRERETENLEQLERLVIHRDKIAYTHIIAIWWSHMLTFFSLPDVFSAPEPTTRVNEAKHGKAATEWKNNEIWLNISTFLLPTFGPTLQLHDESGEWRKKRRRRRQKAMATKILSYMAH